MSVYRLRQFIWAITAPFKNVDKDILNMYLNNKELNLFNRLKISEQQHCIRVCKDALLESNRWQNIDEKKLAKAALLHDIGKVEKRLTVIDKSLIVIFDKITKGRLKKYTSVKKIDIYYNHAKKSLNILKDMDIDDRELLEAVELHHSKEYSNNCYLEIIKKCDNNN